MKIDIHVHTKKTKTGDPQTRAVTAEQFARIVLSTDVKIVAITNHNAFDLQQYDEILEQVDSAVQVWPGVELDVLHERRRAHLLLVVSPVNKAEFHRILTEKTANVHPDDFALSLEDVVNAFDKFEPLYIAHYRGKAPDLNEDGVVRLVDLVANPKRIIKEAANPISAGIFIAHGHASIYGSDVQNWELYASQANNLPELRLPVDSFEQFCLLLEKDPSTIDTAMSSKEAEQLVLQPFEDETEVTLPAFNDINVIFGPKGTGKTKILAAIAAHYASMGVSAKVFNSANDTLADRFNLHGKDIGKNLNTFGLNYCTDEISRLKAAKEEDITSLRKYYDYFASKTRNRSAARMKIKDLAKIPSATSESEFREHKKAHSKLVEMVTFLAKNRPVSEVTTPENLRRLIQQLTELSVALRERAWEHFSDWKSSELTNSASRLFRAEVARKTGTPSMPKETGFAQFARNRLQIKRDAREIWKNLSSSIQDEKEAVGSLGTNKGVLDCVTSFRFQNGSYRDSNFVPVRSGIHKRSQTEFAKCVQQIELTAFDEGLFDALSELKQVEDLERIDTIYGLLLFWRRFSLAGEPYLPSNGECSMLNLHNELATERDVYLLDEPERSLGNEYINDVVIPMINDKARQGKKVFIATHDANIAVRTLPYNSVFRCHDKDGYKTYIGNPFSNNLTCKSDGKILDWKKTSMRTLEGGEAAFGERGKIYGNN